MCQKFVDDKLFYIDDCFETAAYLIFNAKLAILDTLAAEEEYKAQHPDKEA